MARPGLDADNYLLIECPEFHHYLGNDQSRSPTGGLRPRMKNLWKYRWNYRTGWLDLPLGSQGRPCVRREEKSRTTRWNAIRSFMVVHGDNGAGLAPPPDRLNRLVANSPQAATLRHHRAKAGGPFQTAASPTVA